LNPIFQAALELQSFCAERRWKFCFIGAVAVQRWGEPRLTQDVDLTVLTGFEEESTYVDDFLKSFEGRRPDTREFALQYRVLLLRASNGTPADISLGAMPFEARMIERATPFDLGDGSEIVTCGAEDLIVLKAFANRPQDWLDIEGVLARLPPRSIRRELVFQELDPLLVLKGEPEIGRRLRESMDRQRDAEG
jgi:hypothetical protein